jgi:hypothetical protein
MQDTSSLDGLKAHPSNPRTITPQKARMLAKSLKEFGDISGIVLSRKTGTLVTGHMRTDALRSGEASVHITTQYQNPTKTGTVAEGYVLYKGERFSYRETNWDEAKVKQASLSANNNAGAFDMTGLTSWLNELNAEGLDLELTMLSADELMPYLPSMDEEPSEAPAYVAPDSDDFDPETGETTESTMSRTQQVQVHDTAAGQVKAVQLFFDAKAHAKFIELTDVLKEVYGKDNLSDAVFEAVKRASVTAAVG